MVQLLQDILKPSESRASKMLLILTLLLFASCPMVSASSALFLGELAEFRGLPIVVTCEKELAHIKISGITVNNIILPDGQNVRATNQCEKQMKEIDKTRKLTPEERKARGIHVGNTTTCILDLPNAKINATDVVRVVYACPDDELAAGKLKWTKEPKEKKEKKNPEAKEENKFNKKGDKVQFGCPLGNKIMVKRVEVEGKTTHEKYHPEHQPTNVMDHCVKNFFHNKGKIMCSYSKPTGMNMKIYFTCLEIDES